MKVTIDEKRVSSTIALIENHLDGAVADLENGMVDNIGFLEDLAYMHRVLEIVSTGGWATLREDEYVARINKVKESRKDEDEDD